MSFSPTSREGAFDDERAANRSILEMDPALPLFILRIANEAVFGLEANDMDLVRQLARAPDLGCLIRTEAQEELAGVHAEPRENDLLELRKLGLAARS